MTRRDVTAALIAGLASLLGCSDPKTSAPGVRIAPPQPRVEKTLEDALKSLLEDAAKPEEEWVKNPEGLCQAKDRDVRAIQFFPDGSRLVLLSGITFRATLEVWDVAKRERVFEKEFGRDDWVLTLALSPDGKTLAIGNDQRVELWDTDKWERRQTLAGHEKKVLALAFSADGQLLASGDEAGAILTWNAVEGAQIKRIAWDDAVWGLAFSPDGAKLAAIRSADKDENPVGIWDPRTGDPFPPPPWDSPQIYVSLSCVAFSRDGKLLAVGDNGLRTETGEIIRLWDTASGKYLKTLQGHHGKVTGLAFTRDHKRLISAAEDGTVRVWDVASGQPAAPLWGHPREIKSLALSPDEKTLVTGDEGKGLRFWDLEEIVQRPEKYHTLGAERQVFFPHVESTTPIVALSADGATLVTIEPSREIKLWDLPDARLRKAIRDDSAAGPVLFSPDGQYLAYCSYETKSKDGELKELCNVALLDLKSFEKKPLIQGMDGCGGLAFLANSADLIVGEGTQIAVWKSGKKARSWDTGEAVRSLALFADGSRIASGDAKGSIKIWDFASQKLLHTLSDHKNPVTILRVTPDGQRLLSLAQGLGESKIRVWNLQRGEKVGEVETMDGDPNMMLLPDNKTLVYNSHSDLVLWDLDQSKALRKLHGHVGEIGPIRISQDGKRMVTADDSGAVRLWDLP